MANTAMVGSTGKYTDLWNRVIFLVGALVVFRIGAHIPVPGIDPAALATMFQAASGGKTGLLDMFNMFSGGALSRFTVFAIGIMPYISASIVMQLASELLPSLKQLKKEGEAGRRKITQYTRYGTVLLAMIQSITISVALFKQPGLVIVTQWEFYITTVISLVTGTMFLMWLGEQITERGIGNGISLIICAGIASGIPGAIFKTLSLAENGSLTILFTLLLFAGVLAITYFVVFVESGQRKVLVNYAKRQVGNRVLQGQNTHISLKLNMAGVIPPIFASSIILFPATALEFLGDTAKLGWLKSVASKLHPGEPVYVLLYAVAIIFFCFFYTALVYSPRDIADNLKKSGAFIPGIRPGEHTSKYIEKILLRLTLIGSIYITLVCLMPEFIILKWSVPFYFGGTSLLIMVVVAMDFRTQLESLLFSQQYESLLKKASFKNK